LSAINCTDRPALSCVKGIGGSAYPPEDPCERGMCIGRTRVEIPRFRLLVERLVVATSVHVR
jgi:hypothetical protein